MSENNLQQIFANLLTNLTEANSPQSQIESSLLDYVQQWGTIIAHNNPSKFSELSQLLKQSTPQEFLEHFETLDIRPYDYNSIYLLIKLIVDISDEKLVNRAIQILEKFALTYDNRAYIPQMICETWANTRNSYLEGLMVAHGWVPQHGTVKATILAALKTGKTVHLSEIRIYEIKALVEAMQDKDPEISEQAEAFLSKQELDGRALSTLAKLWVETRKPSLLKILLEKDYIPSGPPEVRILVTLKSDKWESLAVSPTNVVKVLAQATQDEDRFLADRATQVLRKLSKRPAQQELCRIVIERDLPYAQQAAFEAGFLPTETYQKALFYFLNEQWDKYEGLDFDHRFLQTAYATADATLRRRLAEKVRQAGKPDYLSAISGGSARTRATEVTLDEAELMVQILAARREWEKLWQLIGELPLHWSAQAIKLLAGAGWQPEKSEDQTFFEQLKELAYKPMITSEAEANKLLPPALLRAKARVPGRINDLAFSPVRSVIAIGTGTGKVVLWNWQKAEREKVLSDFDHSVGRVAFTPNGTLLCGERTNTDTGTCLIHVWKTEEHFRLGPLNGSINAVEAVNDTQILSSSRDNKLSLWDLSTLILSNEYHPYFRDSWVRGFTIAVDRTKAALFNKKITLLSLPELKFLTATPINLSNVAQYGAFTPDEKGIVVGQANGQLLFCPFDNKGKFTDKFEKLARPAKPGVQVQGVVSLPALSLIVAATSDGQIDFIDWPSRENSGQAPAPGNRLTSLKVSPDGAFMAVGDSDASFSLWDLRVLELHRLFDKPLARGKTVHMAALASLAESQPALDPALQTALCYIETVLRHRFRYDVELAETAMIEAGEFDIEVEG